MKTIGRTPQGEEIVVISTADRQLLARLCETLRQTEKQLAWLGAPDVAAAGLEAPAVASAPAPSAAAETPRPTAAPKPKGNAERPCVICGSPFVPRTNRGLTCGPDCRKTHHRNLVTGWNKAHAAPKPAAAPAKRSPPPPPKAAQARAPLTKEARRAIAARVGVIHNPDPLLDRPTSHGRVLPVGADS